MSIHLAGCFAFLPPLNVPQELICESLLVFPNFTTGLSKLNVRAKEEVDEADNRMGHLHIEDLQCLVKHVVNSLANPDFLHLPSLVLLIQHVEVESLLAQVITKADLNHEV